MLHYITKSEMHSNSCTVEGREMMQCAYVHAGRVIHNQTIMQELRG